MKNAVDKQASPYYTYATNYRQLRDIYQERYPASWEKQLISDIAKERREQNPNYKLDSARRQVSRYEAYINGTGKQPRNPDKPVGAMKTALRDIGREQEPIKKDAPPDGMTITISGDQGGGRKSRSRDFTLKMDYQFAQQFVQDPSLDSFFAELYPNWPDAVKVLFGNGSGVLGNVSIA